MSAEYVPFGPEWEKEVMKLNKPTLIAFYRRVCLGRQDLLEALQRLKEGLANEEEHGLWDADYILRHIIRPAIAKAEGSAK